MPTLDTPHTSKALDRELNDLIKLISRIGGKAENQLESSARAILERDEVLAADIIKQDSQVDQLDAEIQQKGLEILALRSPVADDLRLVVSALKVSGAFERVADYAANTAKRSLVLNSMPAIPATRAIVRLMHMVQKQLHMATSAFVDGDSQQAVAVWEQDDEIDAVYSSLFREILTYMMEDPRQISICTHLLFISKNVERIGDHSTNIAEHTYFMVEGKRLRDRPKADMTSSLRTPTVNLDEI